MTASSRTLYRIRQNPRPYDHAFLEIAADDTITVWMGQTDLDQGTHTGIPMIIADELDAAWDRVQVKMALAADPFKDPQWHAQVTGGSSSIRHRWEMLRKVGAAARQMLVDAAAEQWGISAQTCDAKDGNVSHPDAVAGIRDMPYSLPNLLVNYVMVTLPVTVGWWRSVGYFVNVFAVKSFMDELAHAAGKDPVQFRLDHMEKGSRPYTILSQPSERLQ